MASTTAISSTSSLLQTHVDTLLFAIASSTDNFAVGISAGFLSSSTSTSTSRSLLLVVDNNFWKVNLVVALCNAAGTLVATFSGDTLSKLPELALQKLAAAVTSSSSPETFVVNYSIESLLAGLAFAYLAWKESGKNDDHKNSDDDEDDKTKKNTHNKGLSYAIALPMTLNNLAGGVAAGVMGVSAFMATLYAFVVSLGSMALGYVLARKMMNLQQQSHDSSQQTRGDQNRDAATKWCKYVSILVYVLLSLQSFWEV